MNSFYDKDWRKKASLTATNDLDIEKAFSDQASGFVENKVGDLMKDQYRIGFEIVKKNDENTRMVGIFAFKVEQDLLFAPVFFINGEIKGPLLYRCNTKTFVPANKEWATYLIESMEQSDGKGRDRSRRYESAPMVQMQRISMLPPGMSKASSVVEINVATKAGKKKPNTIDESQDGKKTTDTFNCAGMLSSGDSILKMAAWDDGTVRISVNDTQFPLSARDADSIVNTSVGSGVVITAPGEVEFTISAHGVDQIKKAFFENVPNNVDSWAEPMFAHVAESAAHTGLLHEFMTEPDYGKIAAESILKAASGKEGYDFANTLASIYADPSTLFPAKFSTSTEPAPAPVDDLVIHYSQDGLSKEAAVSREYFNDGFYIQDSRPTESMSVIFKKNPDTLQAPSMAGEYSILMQDGSFCEDAFAAKWCSDTSIADDMRKDSDWCYSEESLSDLQYVVISDKKVTMQGQVLGTLTRSAASSTQLVHKVQPHKVYFAHITGSDGLIGPITVITEKTVDGVQYCEIMYRRGRETIGCPGTDTCKNVIINPDVLGSDLDNAVFGSDARFIEVDLAPNKGDGSTNHPWDSKDRYCSFPMKELTGVGSYESVDKWVFNKFGNIAVSVKAELGIDKKASFRFTDSAGNTSPRMNKCVAMVKLARDMEIPAPTAYTILDDACESGEATFWLDATEKVASRLHVIDRPNFDDEFDSEFGIPIRPEKEYALRVQGDQDHEPPSAIGDVMNPTTTTGLPNLTVATTPTEDLRALADTYHLPHVFEHGVVGTLADTFNSLVLIDKYIPKLEDGVDALGRIKFLLHWCPSDFEKAYGSDDMTNLEAEIDSNFDAQGAVLLKLLKKSDKQKKSTDNNKLID